MKKKFLVEQLERDLIRLRQREGIELAKKEGKFKGRLKKYHKNQVLCQMMLVRIIADFISECLFD
ncbi:hypothetical protein [Amphibacillus cookii]|uniref:hypothetical protein n=1 Tax=Amphibacillus cookii TaxID=767787 RepID=UPI003B83941E|nr:DNA invertase Pin-like site-specific DNA recombinase [Amphibacillus cookii]